MDVCRDDLEVVTLLENSIKLPAMSNTTGEGAYRNTEWPFTRCNKDEVSGVIIGYTPGGTVNVEGL